MAGDRVVVGLVGRGIQSSRTPGMHEREARRLGIGYSYLLLDFDQLGLADAAIGDVVAAAQAAGFQGLNVTHPFKQSVIPVLDALSLGGARHRRGEYGRIRRRSQRGPQHRQLGFCRKFSRVDGRRADLTPSPCSARAERVRR